MLNTPQHLRKSLNQFPELDHNRLQIDQAMQSRALSYIQSFPDFERVQTGEIAPSVFIEQVVASSPKEISSAVRVMCAVILGAFVMQGCGAAKVDISHPDPETDITADAGTDIPDASADEKAEKKPVNILAEYPSEDKQAVIINGDSEEERHIKNVEMAIEVLRQKGFNKFYVVADQKLEKDGSMTLEQFSADHQGVDKMFEALGVEGVLDDKDFVFFYVTGHGGKNDDEANISLRGDENYPKNEFFEKLKLLKEKKVKAMFVFDQCFGGAFSADFRYASIDGVAMSPSVEDDVSCCGNFTPAFFDGMKEDLDLDKDGVSESIEWFRSAMANYDANYTLNEKEAGFWIKNGVSGKYVESRTELSLENADGYLKSGQPFLIYVSTTWCPGCKAFSGVIDQINGLVGEKIDILTIVQDVNPEASELFAKFGTGEVNSFPSLFIRMPDGRLEKFKGRDENKIPVLAEILLQLKDKGIQLDISVYEENFLSEIDPNRKIERTPDFLQKWPEKLIKALVDNPEIALKYSFLYIDQPWGFDMLNSLTAMDPNSALKYSHNLRTKEYYLQYMQDLMLFFSKDSQCDMVLNGDGFAEQPGYEDAMDEAIVYSLEHCPAAILISDDLVRDNPKYKGFFDKAVLSSADFDPKNAIQYSDKFKDKPYYKKVLKKAVFNVLEKDPSIIFDYSDKFRDQPYYNKVLKDAISRCVEDNPLVILAYAPNYEDLPYYKGALKDAARKVAETNPEIFIYYLDNYIDEPWAEELLMRTAETASLPLILAYEAFKGHPTYEKALEKACRFAALNNGIQFFVLISGLGVDFNNRPYLQEILSESAKQFKEKDKKSLLALSITNPEFMQKVPMAEEMIRGSIDDLLKDEDRGGIYFLLGHLNEIKEFSWAEYFIRSLIPKYHGELIVYLPLFVDMPWTEDVVYEIYKQDPGTILYKLSDFIDKPWAKDFVYHAYEKDQKSVLYHLSDFIDKPWAKDFAFMAMEDGHTTLILISSGLKDQPWAKDFFMKAAVEDKYRVMLNVHLFVDKPWALEVLKVIPRLVLRSELNLLKDNENPSEEDKKVIKLFERALDR